MKRPPTPTLHMTRHHSPLANAVQVVLRLIPHTHRKHRHHHNPLPLPLPPPFVRRICFIYIIVILYYITLYSLGKPTYNQNKWTIQFTRICPSVTRRTAHETNIIIRVEIPLTDSSSGLYTSLRCLTWVPRYGFNTRGWWKKT